MVLFLAQVERMLIINSYEHSWPCSGRLLIKWLCPLTSASLRHMPLSFPQQDIFWNQDLRDYIQLIIWKAFSSGLQAIKLNTVNVGLAGLHTNKSCSVFCAKLENQFLLIAWCMKSAASALHCLPIFSILLQNCWCNSAVINEAQNLTTSCL